MTYRISPDTGVDAESSDRSNIAAVLALLVLGWAVVSGVLARANINGPLVFTVVGFALANPDWGPLKVNFEAPSIHLIAELTLALLLFADASRMNVHKLRHDVRLPARLLGIGLPLSVILGSLLAAWLLDDLSWALAGFIGATLSPTDASLSAQVINDEGAEAGAPGAQRGERAQRRDRHAHRRVHPGGRRERARPRGDHHVRRGRALVELALGVGIGLAVGLGSALLLMLGTRHGWIGRAATGWALMAPH